MALPALVRDLIPASATVTLWRHRARRSGSSPNGAASSMPAVRTANSNPGA